LTRIAKTAYHSNYGSNPRYSGAEEDPWAFDKYSASCLFYVPIRFAIGIKLSLQFPTQWLWFSLNPFQQSLYLPAYVSEVLIIQFPILWMSVLDLQEVRCYGMVETPVFGEKKMLEMT
jgi:hypothetical protein